MSATSPTADPIPDLRARIDQLDGQIMRLLDQRAKLSGQVQAHRIAAGGVRLALGREQAVLQTYRAGLGESGTAVGEAVLRLCRGRI
ncbi:MAG TPA: chorismate mutase [Mycobacteriales bacterium]|nr:chorismate mutase [Mycobacteriales bacterium]